MRFSYTLPIFLSVLVIVSACQGGTHRMCMENNGSQATGHEKEESHIALAPSVALVSGHSDTNSQNGNGPVLPAPSSNGSHGTLAPTTQSVHTLQPPSAISDKNAIERVMRGKDEKKETGQDDNRTVWFESFVDAVDHAEEWSTIQKNLEQGQQYKYLTACVGWEDDQYTPLHYAAQEGDLEVVRELVEKYQVPVHIKTDGYERTPLHLAALRWYLEVVQYLVDKGAKWSNTDNAKSNALHYAALGIQGQKNTDVVKFLRNHGADLEVLADDKFNLLHLAIRTSNVSLVKYLMEQCPDLAHKTSGGILSPLELAKAKEERIAEIIQERLKGMEKDPCGVFPCFRVS